VNVPHLVPRPSALRWLVPVGVLGVAALAATGMFKESAASASLPITTPAKLIAAVQQPHLTGFSGTVVSQLSLGLPELPALGSLGDGSSMASLLAGANTLQVWYGGLDKQRVALLGSTDETDLFRDGRELWQWSSADRVAVHTVLPAGTRAPVASLLTPGDLTAVTPSALARQALTALEPSTKVTVVRGREVAERSAYELVLTPRASATKIGSVRISVDGATKVPLGVQIYARGATSAAVDVAFTRIRFGRPSDTSFKFAPPPDAKVRTNTPELPTRDPANRRPTKTGTSWTTVVDYRGAAVHTLTNNPVWKQLTPVSGTWGKGRLLDSALLSVLVTSDGRVYAGAVEPSALYVAAGAK
jgi:hypothetical protein